MAIKALSEYIVPMIDDLVSELFFLNVANLHLLDQPALFNTNRKIDAIKYLRANAYTTPDIAERILYLRDRGFTVSNDNNPTLGLKDSKDIVDALHILQSMGSYYTDLFWSRYHDRYGRHYKRVYDEVTGRHRYEVSDEPLREAVSLGELLRRKINQTSSPPTPEREYYPDEDEVPF